MPEDGHKPLAFVIPLPHFLFSVQIVEDANACQAVTSCDEVNGVECGEPPSLHNSLHTVLTARSDS